MLRILYIFIFGSTVCVCEQVAFAGERVCVEGGGVCVSFYNIHFP